MGVDIGYTIEVKTNNEWICVYSSDKQDEGRIDSDKWPYIAKLNGREYQLIGDRDYGLFALLADVCNDGFIIPISQQKGLPKDMSEGTSKDAEFWECSYSYYTLEELMDHKFTVSEFSHTLFETMEYMRMLTIEYKVPACGVRLVFGFGG